MRSLLLLALPGGALLYAATFLFRCRHRHEQWDRVDDRSVLRCADCRRVRPNILADAMPAYRRTQEPGNCSAIPNNWTGIERMAAEDSAEDRAISAELVQIERSDRWRQARTRTLARFGGSR